MVMGVVVQSNIKQVVRNLDEFQRKQVPFATSRALNDTATDVQDAEIRNVELVFNNKKKWYAKGNPRTGIRREYSNKQKLVASVFSRAEFLDLQENGGVKHPKKGHDVIDIPEKNVPKRYQKRGGARQMTETSNNVVKVGNAVYRKRGKKLQRLFNLVKQVRVRPRLRFEKVAAVAAKRKFDRNFQKRLQEAIATSKLK